MKDTYPDPTGLQFLANSTRQAIFTYDVEENRFIYLNPAFEQLFDITKGSTANTEALLSMVHPEDQKHIIDTYKGLLEERTSEGIEFRIQLPEQGERWVCVTAFLSENTPGEQRVTGYLEDITPTKKYISYLNKYGNKKNSVLHILAHDLAGTLAMIRSLSGVLAEEAKAYSSKRIDELIELIEKTSAQGGWLVKDLLNHEFLETTGVDLIKRRTNLVARLEQIMEQYRQSEGQINKTFHFFPSSKEIFVEFDDTKLIQAVNNLISNAIKFTHKGGVIKVSVDEKQGTVVIKVADNGVGIPEKYHESLFDKFTPARRPGLEGEPTTGLGMSIIKTIVEWHKGQTWFESKEGEGTTFFIEIPKE